MVNLEKAPILVVDRNSKVIGSHYSWITSLAQVVRANSLRGRGHKIVKNF